MSDLTETFPPILESLSYGPVKRRGHTSPQDESWLPTEEGKFWLQFFTFVDNNQRTNLSKDFQSHLESDFGFGISWSFWAGQNSYTAALKKTIDQFEKIGGFSRFDLDLLKSMVDEILKKRRQQLNSSTKAYKQHKHALEMWVKVRESMDNPPWDLRRVGNLVCDVIVGMIAVTLFLFFILGIYTVVSRYK